MPAGQPPIFSSPDQLNERIEAYFDQFRPAKEGEDKSNPEYNEWRPSITGLVLFCGFASRQSFYDYEKREGFSYTIKRARARIENVYEQFLTTKTAAGAIFALKNFEWTDKQEIDQKTEHSGGINISWKDPELPNTQD